MATVGAYEAKTHFAQLLDRVARGERVVITRHGRPVAVLVPAAGVSLEERQAAIAELRSFRCGRRLEKGELRRLLEEGRR